MGRHIYGMSTTFYIPEAFYSNFVSMETHKKLELELFMVKLLCLDAIFGVILVFYIYIFLLDIVN